MIDDGRGYHADESARNLLSKLQQWRNTHGNHPRLAVYTNWPELLCNTGNFWNVTVIGPSQTTMDMTNGRPGLIERNVRDLHKNTEFEYDHVLFVSQPRWLDLADLMFWVDPAVSTLISSDWSCVFYTRSLHYNNCFVDLSHQETNQYLNV
jgi:hypothetical protein